MSIDNYKQASHDILSVARFDKNIAIRRYHNLCDIYVMDGSLAGEEHYGNNMIEKGQILMNLQRILKD